MQNEEDQSKEHLPDGSEPASQASDLAGGICTRYGGSPGVISTEFGNGVTDHVHQFSDRLPLLRTLQRRWNMKGFSFPAPASPLLFRRLASRKSAERVAPVSRMSAPASIDGSSGISTVESSPSGALASQEANSSTSAELQTSSTGHVVSPDPAGYVHPSMTTLHRTREGQSHSEVPGVAANDPSVAARPAGSFPSSSTRVDTRSPEIPAPPAVEA